MGSTTLRGLMWVALLAGLTGCAGISKPISANITKPPPGNFQLVEAVANPDANVGRQVRWGGEVIEVNRDAAGNYEVMVLERRLTDNGRPMYKGPSDGRFVIRATAAVDPDLYRVGTDITVAGSFAGMVSPSRPTTPGPLPLVKVTDVENWRYGVYPDPYYYGPYYHRPYYGPRVRFGVGIHKGLHRHGRYRGHYGYPYWW